MWEAKAEMSDRMAQPRVRHAQPRQATRPILPGEIRRVRIGRPANDNKSGLASQVMGLLAAAAVLSVVGVLSAHFLF